MVWRKYGLELEMTGITRKCAAELVAGQFGITAAYSFEGDKYSVVDTRGRTWAVAPCPGVRAERWQNNRMVGANQLYQVRVCTPMLYENDFETVGKILGRLKTGGAVTNESTGMAVLLSTAGLDDWERFENNLDNLYRSKGALLQKAIGREFRRLAELALMEGHGVISMPLFPGSLDENNVRSYVQLSQCIAGLAAKSKGIRHKENNSPNEKFQLRTWLVRLGFVGEEFKYARKLLTENLSGNSAWLRKVEMEPWAGEMETEGHPEILEVPPSPAPAEGETEPKEISQNEITM